MRHSYAILLSCLIVAAFTAVACDANKAAISADDKPEDVSGQTAKDITDNVKSEYSFYSSGAPSTMSEEGYRKVAAVNSFAFAFVNELQKQEQGSFVCSPASLGCLLGMLSEGSDGETRKELCRALGFDESDQDGINEFFRDLIVLSSPDEGATEDLAMANVVVADNRFDFVEQFKKNIAGYYDGCFKNMDFSNGKAVADYINSWASEHTNGRIKKVVEDVNGILCLVNALYFKGNWSFPFYMDATTEELFETAVSGKRTVKMMHMTDDANGIIKYTDKGAYRMINLSYGNLSDNNNRYSFSVMLPEQGQSIEDMLAGMNAESWASSHDDLHPEFIKLSLPSFSTDSNIESDNLKSLLGKAGVKLIFDPVNANFSNLTEKGGIYVELMKHLANISVDENGTEAAAVSYAEVSCTALPPEEKQPEYVEFNCNRPFLYAISDSRTGAILCIGCYR